MAQFESSRAFALIAIARFRPSRGSTNLPAALGREAEIAPLTDAAMNGLMPIEEFTPGGLRFYAQTGNRSTGSGSAISRHKSKARARAVAALQAVWPQSVCREWWLERACRGSCRRTWHRIGAMSGRSMSISTNAVIYREFERNSPLTRSDGKARVAAGSLAAESRGPSCWSETAEPMWRHGAAGHSLSASAALCGVRPWSRGADLFVEGPSLLDVAARILA